MIDRGLGVVAALLDFDQDRKGGRSASVVFRRAMTTLWPGLINDVFAALYPAVCVHGV